jgi:RNA-directed DNA polymerase
MEFEAYSKKFKEKAQLAGYSSQEIDKCLEYAGNLLSQNLPVIYNTDHLSVLVGYSKSYIKRAVSHPNSFYRKFYILKKNKQRRQLAEPLPSLKEIQRWILNNLLYKLQPHRYAKAYFPGFTIKDNFKYHKKKNHVLSLDITNFFESVSYQRIEALFKNIGYAPIVASLLTKLVTLNGSLAQGAPTSPHLSNLILRQFDHKVESYCKNNKLMYTRYADDLTFSGKEIGIDSITTFIQKELSELGLELNESKSKFMPSHGRQIVTGIVVNMTPQIPRNKRKDIRQEVYYIKKYGIDDHLKKVNMQRQNYLKHLLGRVNYSLFINPKDDEMRKYKEYLTNLL